MGSVMHILPIDSNIYWFIDFIKYYLWNSDFIICEQNHLWINLFII